MGAMNESITTHEQWLAARKNGIGASECSAIVGMNPYMSSVELWKLKTGRKEAADISSKPHVAYGRAAEEPLRELFALDYADRFEVGYGGEFDVVRHPQHPFIFATLDGRLVEKETGRKGVLEIKTTEILRSMQREKWQSEDGPCIPDNYYCQICWQMLATGFDFAVLHAQLKRDYGGGDIRCERRSYFVEREDAAEDIAYLYEEGLKFWQYVVGDREPPLVLPPVF